MYESTPRARGATVEVVILLERDDRDRARVFARSDDRREAMVRAGMAYRPDLWFLE